jgi:hypothetical protein
MKKKIILSFLILLFISGSFYSRAQNTGFSGQWKLDKVKTVMADDQLFLSRITLQLKKDSLLSIRVYENYNGEEYPFVENLSLDGKDCNIYIYDMPRTSKASLSKSDGSIVIESKTTFYGNNGAEDIIAKETWKVDKGGKVLSIDFSNKTSAYETTGTNYYNKIE